jgi:hypothetical protein
MKRALLFTVIASLLATGCITRTVKEPVFEQDKTRVFLRSQHKGGETLAKGFGHPLAISAARLAHILSRIDVRGAGGDAERRAAIPLDSLYVIAEGMSKALAKADPDQEVVVMSVRKTKHFMLFDRDYLNSLVAYVRDDLLCIHLSRVDWEIDAARKTELPEPRVDEQVMPFHLLISPGMTLLTAQAVAVSWRDPVFRRATRTRVLPSGKVVRREILMESPEDAPTPPITTDVLPGNLTPGTLRKLADLEEQKNRGEVTQTQYTVLRETILRADPAYSE